MTPESNQTSRVSWTFSYSAAPATPIRSAASRVNQASTPWASTRRATASISSGVRGCRSPVSLWTSRGMGTPQVRWREMHQSGRLRIMASMRDWPQSGVQVTRSISRRAASRNPCFSMPMNHWGVARKMMGVLWRQQWG